MRLLCDNCSEGCRDGRLCQETVRAFIDAPPTGGGEKYEPQTAVQARRLLLPMVNSVLDATASLPTRLRADRVYVEARLLPNYLAASHFPGALLAQIGAVPVGSRADTGVYRTKSRSHESPTRRLILAVSDDGLATLQRLVSGGGQSRSERQAFEEIRKLDRVSIPGADEIVLSRPGEGIAITWEAVLHPATLVQGEAEPLGPNTMEKWFTLVESLGGRSYRDFVRHVGGLTFAPALLAESAVDQLARFNPLRALRPMPSIRPRPSFGTRATARAIPPLAPTPRVSSPLVAVFDGGLFDHLRAVHAGYQVGTSQAQVSSSTPCGPVPPKRSSWSDDESNTMAAP